VRRVAVITGASRGIGEATALVLTERGYQLVVNYRPSAAQAAEVVQAARAGGGEAVAIQAIARQAIDAVAAELGVAAVAADEIYRPAIEAI
jgi:NAD(P)-dependent dehydrogenase (short-subunit alcohol dehydrogenase family)